MRYLDALLGEAKSPFKTIKKIKGTKKKLADRSMDAEDARDKAFGRGDDEEGYKQGDKHHNAMERSGRLSVFADKLARQVHLRGGGKGDGKPRGKLRLVQGMAYQQIGDILAEALNLFEAKNPPMPSPEELSLPGPQGAGARFERGAIHAAERRGRTTATTKNTRKRRNKMRKNSKLKRGSADTRQYGGPPMGRMAQRELQNLLDRGVPGDSK